MIEIIKGEFALHGEVFSKMEQLSSSIEAIAEFLINSIRSSDKIVLFGNGGSAADAQHITAELVGRYKIF